MSETAIVKMAAANNWGGAGTKHRTSWEIAQTLLVPKRLQPDEGKLPFLSSASRGSVTLICPPWSALLVVIGDLPDQYLCWGLAVTAAEVALVSYNVQKCYISLWAVNTILQLTKTHIQGMCFFTSQDMPRLGHHNRSFQFVALPNDRPSKQQMTRSLNFILLLLLLLLLTDLLTDLLTYWLTYLMQLSFHSVAVVLTSVQTKQIIYTNERVQKHSTNNTKHSKYKYTYYQNTHT